MAGFAVRRSVGHIAGDLCLCWSSFVGRSFLSARLRHCFYSSHLLVPNSVVSKQSIERWLFLPLLHAS